MKRNKYIRIIKEKPSGINYTFIDAVNTIKSDESISLSIKNEQHNGDDKQQPLESQNNKQEKFKKKKVIHKLESKSKFDKSLKFSNPSQRNHSSVYE